MVSIFEQGYFSEFSRIRLDESMAPITDSIQCATKKTTVFISHKHDDLDDLKGLLGFFENTFDVKVYIDSQDPSMPKKTSAQTALNIKERIKKCDKFILLATSGAIESKWCNWELGYGDAQKFQSHIALVPMKPKGTRSDSYVGSEYMEIYPCIVFYDGSETYKDGSKIARGYYVRYKKENRSIIVPLKDWFKHR